MIIVKSDRVPVGLVQLKTLKNFRVILVKYVVEMIPFSFPLDVFLTKQLPIHSSHWWSSNNKDGFFDLQRNMHEPSVNLPELIKDGASLEGFQAI